ncbi:MAG TPA: response regulator, partial [Phenylobacterium sp.]|uniref:response regulator n=1 Tax=Phenylobacterium sp. TaxID=1871053 RepID=UPI002D134684
QSGGRLVLKSQPGEGTRIELWLPRAESAGVERAATRPPQSPATGNVLTVLAVDDDELVLTNTAAMLEDLGHRVLAATSAADAMVLLARSTPDVVITDFAMPQVTGLQLAEEIRARHPGMPVVLATGYAELPPGVGEDLMRLSKPYGQAELAEMLQQACPPRPRRGEPSPTVSATG